MTDPRNASPGSYWTSVRPNRPDAASPAGWFPPPAGEAAPPVRLREPARSDAATQYDTKTPYDVETRPTATYRVPSEATRKRRGQPASPASRRTPADPRADAPDPRWPSLVRRRPRHIPVVGPTEALRGPAGGPRVGVPPAPDGQSGWQLAQRAWQENGFNWEEAAPAQSDDAVPDPYAPTPYTLESHARNTYPDVEYPDDAYPDDASPEDAHPDDMYPDDEAFEDVAPEEEAPDASGTSETPEDPTAQEAPRPLPWRVRPQAFAQPSAFAPSSPFAPSASLTPSPSFAPSASLIPSSSLTPSSTSSPAFESRPSTARSPVPGTTRPFAAPPLSAPVAPAAPVATAAPTPGESDELFRALQGSVREAAGRLPRSARGLGWQVAKIGVPAAVIVTVGAGALLMLTGRANQMLTGPASTGPASTGPASTGPASVAPSGQASGTASVGTAGLTLAGYPGQNGSVGVAALWSAGGTTMAVGYADNHPAVWRHAANGSWSLVSAAVLGGLAGHLTSVAQGPSGWIAVGSMKAGGTVQPVVLGSPDGVAWTPLPALTALAGSDAQFVGAAAGPGGYLVVGKHGSGSRERAAFWWSGDLKTWASARSTGTHAHAAAAVAMTGGFVVVGAMASCHTIWLSPDGRHWTEHDLAKPAGATTASLRSVAVGAGGSFVAAGFATGSAGDMPIVVSSADGGVHVTQVVLSAPQGSATVTAVTSTADGFIAAGLSGSGKAARAVEWTSRDGLIWSEATLVATAGADRITALSDSGGGTVTGTAQRGTGPSVLALPVR